MLREVKKMQGSGRGSERRKEKKRNEIAKGTELKVFRGFAIWAFVFISYSIFNSFL